ncbi:MAG: family 78 glycoside hydrolase catalytic domain [Lachnospirales bacterium]
MLKVLKVFINYELNPTGIEGTPQFSWVIASNKKNVIQKSYELRISKCEDFSNIFFEKSEESSESAQIAFENLKLEPATKYYCQVKISDNSETSPWSDVFYFLTSLEEKWCSPFISAEIGNYINESKGTYLRGEFNIEKTIQSAYGFTTSLGLYNFYLNGKKVGNDEMTPGWTSYNRNLLYQSYDVTDYLKKGENCAGALLGAGWYKGVIGLTKARNNYGEKTAFSMKIIINYTDGTKGSIYTNENWKGVDSPVIFSEIYDGETYDANKEIKNWCEVGTKTEPSELWRNVDIVDFNNDIIRPQSGSRVKVIEEIPCKELIITPKNEKVLNFGQNLTGRLKITATGKVGDIIELRCFEVLDKDGNVYLDNMRAAKTTIKYIFDRDKEVTFNPIFTFMGFQYAKIISYPSEIKEDNFVAQVMHSEMEDTGTIETSNPLLNQLHHNFLWGLKGNFLDIPTDCPQRDERLGWTGDAQIFCRTAMYLKNSYTFYKKWMVDVAVDQTEDGGVAHVVPNIEEGRTAGNWLLSQGEHSASAWADVAVIVPWTMYLMYGDKEILKRQYKSMKAWINFMETHSTDYIWNYKLQFGDWVALDAEEGSYFGATPNDLTCTAYFAYSTGIFSKIAKVLGETEDYKKYCNLYSSIVNKFQETFFTSDGTMTAQTQTAHIIALYFKLTPKNLIEKTVDSLKKLLDKENGHLVTGFVGTPYFCHALSENNALKEAYDLLLKEDFPSWLYQVKMGATTIWEHWDGIKPDGTMWSPGMNSFNHYAYGAIGEWFYRVMLGLEVDENVAGFKHAIIRPRIGGGLNYVDGNFDSIYGKYKIRWDYQDTVTLKITIPPNASATVVLDNAKEILNNDSLDFTKDETGYFCEVGSGEYTLVYTY